MTVQTKVEASPLSAAMAAAFAEIEGATKSSENPAFKQGGRASKYADLTAVIEAIKPALIAHSLFFTQHCHPSEDGVVVETVLGHASGEEKSLGKLFVPANKKDAQGFGSALSYARRYALLTAFGVPTEDDDGNAAVASQRAQREPVNDTNGHGDEPAPREKLEGKHSSKTALKAALQAYGTKIGQAASTREIDAIVKEYAADLAQGERYLPLWMAGDPSKDNKGLVRLTNERRNLVWLIEGLRANDTVKSRDHWYAANEAEIEKLDDAAGREFQRAFEQHDAGMKLLASQN